MKKGIALSVFIVGIFLLSLSFTSALEFDNVLRSEKTTGQYDKLIIKDSFLGIPTTNVAELNILNDGNNCMIDCSAIINVTLYEDISVFDQGFDVVKNNGRLKSSLFNIYYEVENCYDEWIDTTSETCKNYGINGCLDQDFKNTGYSREICENDWKKYKNEIMDSGNYIFKIESKKEPFEKLDWAFGMAGISKEEIREKWAWWNNSWDYKKPITFNKSGNPTIADFQTKITISYNANMQSDFSDIRFTNPAEDTELPYWIESKTDGVSAEVWVGLEDNVTSTDQTLAYLYYGNSGASSKSSNESVFTLFDDFDAVNSSKWSSIEGSESVSGGYLTLDQDWIYSKVKFGMGYLFEVSYGSGLSDGTYVNFLRDIQTVSADSDAIGGGINCNQHFFTVWNEGSNTGGCASATTYSNGELIGIAWPNSSWAGLYDDGDYVMSRTTNVPDEEMNWTFRDWDAGSFTIDWVRVRGFNDSIINYNLGSEESASSLILNLNSPISNYLSNNQLVNFDCNATSDIGVEILNLTIDEIVNYSITNSTPLENLSINLDYNISEGNHNWTCETMDNSGIQTGVTRNFEIDLTLPFVYNISNNATTNIYGYPETFKFLSNESDVNLESCWYNINGTNQTFTCNNEVDLGILNEGNHSLIVYANDSANNIGSNSSTIEINYYTHNITYVDNDTATILTPNCEFIDGNVSAYPFTYDTHNTTERVVDCVLFGYGNFNHTLTESNKTSYNVSVDPANLWLIFDDYTDVKISWLGGGLDYTNVSSIDVPMRNISIGRIHVEFNNQTQLYSFDNNNNTFIKEYIHIETPDLDQQVKVLSSSNEISNAWVVFKKIDNSTEQITYSAFTDVNGIAHILVDDGTSYDMYVYKEGYEDYSELVYIPHSNTETLIVNLINEDESLADYIFQPSCGNYVGIPRNCTFYVKSFKDTTIHFNYTWNGNDYYVAHNGSEATLTLYVNSTTIPINVTASVNPTKSYSILWEGLGDRSIQLEFDEDEIKDAGNEILGLFYLIVIIIGLIIALSINRIPATKGYGAIGFLVWTGIIAIKFPLLWFIAIPGALYYIFKALWGEND